MIEVLTETDEITGKILKIIKSAQKELYIVSPYIQLETWPRVKDSLNYVINEKKVSITIVTRKTEKNDKNRSLNQLNDYITSCKIYLISDLHSKVYYNESQALITSMNIYQHSAENNHEIGVYFLKEDELQFNSINEHIQYLVSTGEQFLTQEKRKIEEEYLEKSSKDSLSKIEFKVISKGWKWLKVETLEGFENKILIDKAPGLKVGKYYEASVKKNWTKTPYGFNVEYTEVKDLKKIDGYCIICKTTIDFDPDYPLCKSCYHKNKKYRGNIFGKLCHRCGENKSNILDSRPLCYDCYSKLNKKNV
ncbi:MAG: phospholipase D-like domain-containing protein [Promethearchaeota archaeon]